MFRTVDASAVPAIVKTSVTTTPKMNPFVFLNIFSPPKFLFAETISQDYWKYKGFVEICGRLGGGVVISPAPRLFGLR
jgi:hypothetical protein